MRTFEILNLLANRGSSLNFPRACTYWAGRLACIYFLHDYINPLYIYTTHRRRLSAHALILVGECMAFLASGSALTIGV